MEQTVMQNQHEIVYKKQQHGNFNTAWRTVERFFQEKPREQTFGSEIVLKDVYGCEEGKICSFDFFMNALKQFH